VGRVNDLDGAIQRAISTALASSFLGGQALGKLVLFLSTHSDECQLVQSMHNALETI